MRGYALVDSTNSGAAAAAAQQWYSGVLGANYHAGHKMIPARFSCRDIRSVSRLILDVGTCSSFGEGFN
eukprot:m.14126 g.14126  ORF g.14126 m.14126 type:complete len:69 (-) comp6146_c0_seq1:8763-8969(-)